MESDWQHSCKTIHDATSYLLKSKKFTDVSFVVGDEKEVIEAHKLILMARSPVFEGMFDGGETGQNSRVEVREPEISGKSFQLFLKFLYLNEFVVTGDDAAEVLYLAHKYDTKELVSKCSDLLKFPIDITIAVHNHQVATKLQLNDLQTQTMEFILKNGKQLLEGIGFLNIDEETLCNILQCDKLAADEVAVFRAVMRWAENKCDVQNLSRTIENKRTILQNIIHQIRFPTMTSQEFTDEVVAKHKGILTDSETIGIYMNFTPGSTAELGVPSLPFSKTKRFSGTIYTVSPYMNSGYTEDLYHQYPGHGPTVMHKTTFPLSASKNIRITGIELYEKPTGTPQFSFSVFPCNQSMATVLTKLRHNSSSVFDLNNGGIDIPRGVPYVVGVEFGCGEWTFGDRPIMRLSSSMEVNCGEESVTFSFSESSGNLSTCPYQYQYSEYRISSGQIKAIHFAVTV